MRKFFKTTALVLVGLVILVFALANRQVVVFSLDPLGSMDPLAPLVFQMPLFVLAIILVAIGVVIGGVATWFRQGKWRKLVRQHDGEARALRAENDTLKREVELRSVTTVPQIAPPAPGFVANRSE